LQTGFRPRVAHGVFIHHGGSKTWHAQNLDHQVHMQRNWRLFKAKWSIQAELANWKPDGVSLDPAGDAFIPLPDLKSRYRHDSEARWWQEKS
jgi:hypothetical protein